MACLHFSPKLLETNGHFKGAIPLAVVIFSKLAPFLGKGKMKSLKALISEIKIVR